ncbi:MAG: GYD domain-containing protein [Amaricoccus sp.]
MPFYLFQLSYSTEALKGMIAKPSDREAAAKQIAEASGGKLHHLFFSFGRHDVVCLIEAPDDKAMAAVALVVGASGTVSNVMTTKLMTAAEAMDAMAMAGKAVGAYIPPMG